MIPTINLEKTGENIKKIREERGISVKDIQNVMCFTSPNTIYNWQKGKTMPSIDNMVILSSILDVPISEILVIDN